MDRCALFVDASYALADGAMAVHGTRRRDSVSWNHAGLLTLLAGLAKDRTGLPVLRCYWYETAAEGSRTPEQEALAEMPGLKLRLVNVRPGRREGIETPIRRDLVTLAKNGAISDAFIASADEHLAEIVTEVQDLGLRVVILHISADGGWTIPQSLRQECDDIVEISGVHLRPFVELIRGAEPAAIEEIAAIGVRGPAASDMALGALPYQGLALPPGAAYRVPDAVLIGDPAPAAPVMAAPVMAGPAMAGLATAAPAAMSSASASLLAGQAEPAQAGSAQRVPSMAGPILAGPGADGPGPGRHGPGRHGPDGPGPGRHGLDGPGPGQAVPASGYGDDVAQRNGLVVQPGEQHGQPTGQPLVPGGLPGVGGVQADPGSSYPGMAVHSESPAGYLNGTPYSGGPGQQPMAHPGYPGAAHNGAPMNGSLDMAPSSAQNGLPRADYQAAPINNGMSGYGGAVPPGRDQNGPAPGYPVSGSAPAGSQPSVEPLGAGSRGETGQNGASSYGAPPVGYSGAPGEVPGYQNGAMPPGAPHAGAPQNGVYQPGPPRSYGNGMAQASAGQMYPPMGAPAAAAQSAGNGFSPQGQYAAQPQSAAPMPVRPMQPVVVSLPEAVRAAYAEGFNFGDSVGRDAPGLWLDAVIARKPRMPSDLEARLLQGSALPIDSLLHDEVRHSLRRGFWDSLESARR